MRRRCLPFVATPLLLAVLAMGCRDGEAERRAAAQATADAEEKAQEATLTSAMIDENSADRAQEENEATLRANSEMVAAFRLEQSDFRGRLERSLDTLDKEILRARTAHLGDARLRDLRARRDLLKADLDAVNRSTEPDWATLRTKVDRDLQRGRPGAQLPPRDHGVRERNAR